MWETLEGMVREKAQEFIQTIMEEEVALANGKTVGEVGRFQNLQNGSE